MYQVWLPPIAENDPADLEGTRLEKARFLREGLSPFAILFPALWLIYHRLWFELTLYIMASIAISFLAYGGFFALYWTLNLIVSYYLFLEGRSLVAAKYERNGYRLDAIIPASSKGDAEILYFHNKLDSGKSENTDPGQPDPIIQSKTGLDERMEEARKRHFSRPAFGLFADQR